MAALLAGWSAAGGQSACLLSPRSPPRRDGTRARPCSTLHHFLSAAPPRRHRRRREQVKFRVTIKDGTNSVCRAHKGLLTTHKSFTYVPVKQFSVSEARGMVAAVPDAALRVSCERLGRGRLSPSREHAPPVWGGPFLWARSKGAVIARTARVTPDRSDALLRSMADTAKRGESEGSQPC